MDNDEEIQKELEQSKLEIAKFEADQERKKSAESIIGAGMFFVIIGLALVFTTSLFDLIMPDRTVNQRAIAVMSIIPFSLGVYSIVTGVAVNDSPGFATDKKKNPIQYKIFTVLWFVVGAVILYIGQFS